jgi:molecular chaperone GrpE
MILRGQSDVMNAGQETNAQTDETPAAEPIVEIDMVGVLTAERDEMKDRLLRTMAEMENLRRRTEKEVADARSYGVTSFARDMLSVVDNLGRGLASIPEADRASADGAFKSLIGGVELTERDLMKILERHGVKIIDPKGEKFDPNKHQAIFEAPDPSTPKGHVMSVAQTGFSIGERVLRPAMVGVSAGGPTVDKTA